MIGRGEAYKLMNTHITSKGAYLRYKQYVNKIYESVGSCGECIFWSKGQYCTALMNEPDTHKDFFCADFEQKEKR